MCRVWFEAWRCGHWTTQRTERCGRPDCNEGRYSYQRHQRSNCSTCQGAEHAGQRDNRHADPRDNRIAGVQGHIHTGGLHSTIIPDRTERGSQRRIDANKKRIEDADKGLREIQTEIETARQNIELQQTNIEDSRRKKDNRGLDHARSEKWIWNEKLERRLLREDNFRRDRALAVCNLTMAEKDFEGAKVKDAPPEQQRSV